MPLIKRAAEVPYTALQMYELVDNIEAYPTFLPWCRSSKILSRDDDEVRATLELARGGLSKSFTTCNRLQPGKMIEVRLVSGPFRHLEGFWCFEEKEKGCRVSLDLEFEFHNHVLSMALSPLFHPIANSLVDSFCQQARKVYA